jgi:hypothetical protein
MQTINISISRTKTMLIFLASITIFCAGVFLLGLSDSEIEASKKYDSPVFVHGVGVFCVFFGFLLSVTALLKIGANRPGLVINQFGLIENTNMFSVGFIPWSNIKRTSIVQVKKHKILYVILKNQNHFLESVGPIKRYFFAFEHKSLPITCCNNFKYTRH